MMDLIDEAIAKIEKVVRAAQQELDLVEQHLGKALVFPWYKDDQKNFPGATSEHGVCVGDHVPETLAISASRRITELEALIADIAKQKTTSELVNVEDQGDIEDGYDTIVMMARRVDIQSTWTEKPPCKWGNKCGAYAKRDDDDNLICTSCGKVVAEEWWS